MVLLAALVFVSAASIDFANVRFVRAVGRGEIHAAARWSVVQWSASLAGFLVAVKVTLWLLPAEAAGLYAGSFASMRWAGKPSPSPGVIEG